MPDYVNTTTLVLHRSKGTQPSGTEEITRAEYDAANSVPKKYRKWTGSAVAEMDRSEKDAVDAADLQARKDARSSELSDVLEAMVDLINPIHAKTGLAQVTKADLETIIKSKVT